MGEKSSFISDSSNGDSWDITKGKIEKPDVGVRQRMKKPAGQRRAGGQSWHHFSSRTSQCKRRHNKNLALDPHKDCKTA